MSTPSVKESRRSYLANGAEELVASASELSFDPATFFETFELLAETPGAIEQFRQTVMHFAFRGMLSKRDDDCRDEELLDKVESDVSALAGKKRSQSKCQIVEPNTWPYDLPETWHWTILGRIANWGSGSTPMRGNPEFYSGTTTWLKSGELNDARDLIGSEEKVTDVAIKKCSFRLNQKGDVLFAMYGATVGKVAILGEEAVTNQAVCGCTPSRYVNNVFLFYYLISQRQTFRDTSEGGAQPNFSKDKIVSYPFPLPPLAEQKRIVAKVDELMGLCDRLEAFEAERKERHASLTRAALARFAESPTPTNLQFLFHNSFDVEPNEIRDGILAVTVSGNLVSQNEADGSTGDVLQSEIPLPKGAQRRRKISKTSAVRTSANDFPTLPESWQYVDIQTLYDRNVIIDFADGNHGSLYPRKGEFGNCGVTFVSAKDIVAGRVSWATCAKLNKEWAVQLNKGWAKGGDVLLTHNATVGRVARVEDEVDTFLLGTSVTFYRVNPKYIDPSFLYHVFCSRLWQKQLEAIMAQTTRNQVSIQKQALFMIPIPPIAEQKRIVSKVDELMALVDQLEQQLAHSRTIGQQLLEAVVANLTAYHG